MMLNEGEKVVMQSRKTRGYLQKKSSGPISFWQRRYFIIIGNDLCYYDDESLDDIKKSIPINQIKSIEVKEENEFQLVTIKRIFQLRALSTDNRDLWVASLTILTNYKQWQENKKKDRNSTKKEGGNRKAKPQKMINRSISPPLMKNDSNNSSKKEKDQEFILQKFFHRVCLSKIVDRLKQQKMKNKMIVLVSPQGCYFMISCKNLISCQKDQDLLEKDLIHPYDFNCLYYYEFSKVENPEVNEICKSCEIESVTVQKQKIRINHNNKRTLIQLPKKIDAFELSAVLNKFQQSIVVGKEYHNTLNIKLSKNIDVLLHQYETKTTPINILAQQQFIKSTTIDQKQPNLKIEFKKNLESIKRYIQDIINSCDVKQPPKKQFKENFIREYHEKIFAYLHKMWNHFGKNYTLLELKKLLILIYEIWKIISKIINDNRLLEGAMDMIKILLDKYENEIISKIKYCFALKESEILDEVSMQSLKQSDKQQTIFLSNKIYKQFHLDIRLTLYELSEMPLRDQSLQHYSILYNNTFKFLCEFTLEYIHKWKDSRLILGTCNEIQIIKNSLFEEMHNSIYKEYKLQTNKSHKFQLKNIESDINNIEIVLVKKLFVLTFSSIDRKILSKNFRELNIGLICSLMLTSINSFKNVNKFVKRNIYEACFEEICYFYYTCIIKFNYQENDTSQKFIKKLTDEINILAKQFEPYIRHQKIHTHLKDLYLIKDFIVCDLTNIKKACKNLKKQFGNSFTQEALKNLINLRDMSNDLKDNLISQCQEIVKNSADTPPQDMSVVGSSRQSFLENWNNTRSRKSTLTVSLNEFYENQNQSYQKKNILIKNREGYLLKKRIIKNINSIQSRAYFKLLNGELIQFENSNDKDSLSNYDLSLLKKCYLHPEKPYIFILETSQAKIQFKSETAEEAKEWLKNIYDEINSMPVLRNTEKQKAIIELSVAKQLKDPSTMDSYLKDQSLQKSIRYSPKQPRKYRKEESKSKSPKSPQKNKPQKRQPSPEGCLRCSRGFIF